MNICETLPASKTANRTKGGRLLLIDGYRGVNYSNLFGMFRIKLPSGASFKVTLQMVGCCRLSNAQ